MLAPQIQNVNLHCFSLMMQWPRRAISHFLSLSTVTECFITVEICFALNIYFAANSFPCSWQTSEEFFVVEGQDHQCHCLSFASGQRT